MCSSLAAMPHKMDLLMQYEEHLKRIKLRVILTADKQICKTRAKLSTMMEYITNHTTRTRPFFPLAH